MTTKTQTFSSRRKNKTNNKKQKPTILIIFIIKDILEEKHLFQNKH